ncbi:MAG: DUF4136 domain-containing protein [Acidobacteria bacterium]|nr:DUF4136 domain-containing protein [Acidobacteriota bacterium]
MRRELTMILATAMILVVPACTTSTGSSSQFEVKTKSAEGIDFHTLTTWRWKPGTLRGAERGEGNPVKMQEDTTRRILEAELSQRGYSWMEGAKPDFYVSFRLSSFHTARRNVQTSQADPSAGPGPSGSNMSRSGSLTVSIWLAGRDTPVWWGSAAGTGAGFLRSDEQLRRAVRAILAEFPPL